MPQQRTLTLIVVPGTGFEPAHLAAYAPKAYVSTNSTIRAYPYYNIFSQKTRYFPYFLAMLYNSSILRNIKHKLGFSEFGRRRGGALVYNLWLHQSVASEIWWIMQHPPILLYSKNELEFTSNSFFLLVSFAELFFTQRKVHYKENRHSTTIFTIAIIATTLSAHLNQVE